MIAEKEKTYSDIKDIVIKEVEYYSKENNNKINYEQIDFIIENEVASIYYNSDLLQIASTMNSYYLFVEFEYSKNLIDGCREVLYKALRDDLFEYLDENDIEVIDE